MMKKAPLIICICFLLACNFFNQKKNLKIILIIFRGLLPRITQFIPYKCNFFGDNRYNDSLPDFLSPEFLAKQKFFYSF